MPPGEPLIRLEHATKAYGRKRVLEIDSLEVRRGDRILLHGTNGSGKSTLLRLLSGLSPLSTGSRRVSAEMRALRIGYGPQSGGIYDDLTVRENLELAARLYDAHRHGAQAAFWFLEALDLVVVLDKRVATLSGGYQKAAMLSMLVLANADCYLLDEPFTGLDASKSEKLRSAFCELAGSLSLLVVTSHAPESDPLFTRELHLADGRIAVES